MRAAVIVSLALGSVAHAQVLHERVHIDRASAGHLKCQGGACFSARSTASSSSANGTLPKAIVDSEGGLHFAPELGRGAATAQPGEQIFSPQPDQLVVVGGAGASGAPGDRTNEVPDRRDVVKSDRETGPEPPGTRYYHMVFDPEPFPFKRMTALDEVGEDEALSVHDRDKRPEALRGAVGRSCGALGRPPCGDLFWGSVLVDFEPGRWVPIPSVAADSHVLEARTEPAAPVEFSVDGAGNMFVRSTAGGRRRLVWLVEASPRYFSGELPRGITLADVPPSLVHAPPPKIRARASEVLRRIGLRPRPSMSYLTALDALVGYFRAFEVGELPSTASSGSTYLDIALSQRGVCRHRSFAFTITALAAGIPARYVENEVHVFVEAWVPRLGWRRINLGGAPLDEALVGAQGKSMYKERGVDPFAKPEAFTRATGSPPKGSEQLAGGGEGATASGAAGRGTEGSGGAGSTGSGTGSGSASGSGSGRSAAASSSREEGAKPVRGVPDRDGKVDLEALTAADEARLARAAAGTIAARIATRIHVELGARESFRGERVEVRGAVEPSGAGLPVEIYLTSSGRAAVKIADLVTDAEGRFQGSVEVPITISVGQHRLIARTPGDERRLPASSSR